VLMLGKKIVMLENNLIFSTLACRMLDLLFRVSEVLK